MPKKDDLKSYTKKLDEAFGGDLVLIDKVYKGSNVFHKFRHSCGQTFVNIPKKVLNKTGKCPCQFIPKPHFKQTRDDYCKKLRRQQPDYTLVGKYLGYDVSTKFRHSCGREFMAKPGSIRTGSVKCPCEHEAYGPEWKSDQEWQRQFNRLFGRGEYTFLERPEKNRLVIRHEECGKEFEVSTNFTHGSHPGKCTCLLEKTGVKPRTDEDWQKQINLYHGMDEYHIVETESYYNRVLEHRCGFRIKVKLNNFCRRGGDPICPCLYNKGSHKVVKISGVNYACMGYEPFTLKKVDKRWPGISMISSLAPNQIKIWYKFKGKDHAYKPDVLVPSKNLIIEVKCLATLGFAKTYIFGTDTFEKTQAKAKYCMRAGYQFMLHLYTEKGKQLKLPDKWYSMDKKQVAKYLNI